MIRHLLIRNSLVDLRLHLTENDRHSQSGGPVTFRIQICSEGEESSPSNANPRPVRLGLGHLHRLRSQRHRQYELPANSRRRCHLDRIPLRFLFEVVVEIIVEVFFIEVFKFVRGDFASQIDTIKPPSSSSSKSGSRSASFGSSSLKAFFFFIVVVVLLTH